MFTIRKGTAPVIEFTLPFSTDLLKTAKVIFKYKDGSKLTKYAKAEDFDGDIVRVQLTQEETFLFDCNSYIKMLLRVMTKNGEPFKSDVYEVFVDECFDNEVLE